MGKQIIKQPNGKYCLFSSIVDNVTYFDLTEEEIVEIWTKEAREEIEAKVKGIVSKLDNGEKPYYQFTKTFEGMIETISDVHGEAVAEIIKKELGA